MQKGTLARELEEETGLSLVGRPKLHSVFSNQSVSKHDQVLVYLCETAGKTAAISQSLEIAHASFFDHGRLPGDIDLGAKHRLEEYAEKATRQKMVVCFLLEGLSILFDRESIYQ